jgi:hypothetical protein
MKNLLTLSLLFVFAITFSQNVKTLQFVSITPDTTLCEDLELNLIVDFTNYISLQWQYYDGSSFTDLAVNPIFNGVDNDTLSFITDFWLDNALFRCIAYDTTNIIYSDTVKLHVLSNDLSINIINDTIFVDPANSYQWYYNGNILLGETNNFLPVNGIGVYSVEVEKLNGCNNTLIAYKDTINIDSAWVSPEEICLGESAILYTNYPICKQANFNDGTIGLLFSSNITPDFSNPCISSIDGSPYLWVGDDACFPRDLTTITMDVTGGTEICFDFVMAVQGIASPCEGPDEMDEGVSFQYSTDNGLSWQDITYFCPNGNEYSSNLWIGESFSGTSLPTNFTEWANYCYTVPLSAITTSTMFQWHQEQGTNQSFDHWGLDNISFCGTNQLSASDFQWFDDQNNLISSYNYTVSPIHNTIYMGVLGSTTGAPDTAYVELVVNPLPEPGIFQTMNTLSTNYFETYQWYKNTLTISGANDYFYNANYSGNFFVEVVDTNGCVGYSDTIYVTITNINEIDENNTIKIYPNPAKDFITIENSDIILSKIEVLDLSGKVILKQEDNSNKITIDISNLEKGTYFIKINEFKEPIKFVKK